jgi:maltose-binding protein MalE
LWHSWSGNDGDALAQILGSFQAAYPDIQIETLFVAYNRLPQAYADAVVAGGGPDLILAPSWWLQELAEVEALLPLDDLVDPAMLDEYWPATVENMRYQDHLYGLPTNFELVTLYYNRDLIDAAELPTTTDEMLALAQADPQQGAGLYANFYHLYWGIGAYGGALFDAEGRVILDATTGAAEFLAWLVEMSNTPGVFVDLDYGMLIDRFKKGEFAFFIDGPWSAEELRSSLGDAIGNAPLPAGPAGVAQPWLNADGVFLNPTASPHQQQLALRLARHLTDVESGAVLASVARRVPAQITAQIDDPLLLGFLEQAQAAIPEPHRPEMAEVWGYAGDMMLKALGGTMTPEDAVIQAAALINEANDK